MKSIVVGVDGSASSERALAWAARAVGPDGTIHAVAAVSPLTELAIDAVLGDSVGYVHRLQHELETVWLAPVRGLVGTVTAVADEGWASTAIIGEARRRNADAIVIGAHIPARHLPKTIGTTTRKLLKNLPCPLLVVPDGWDTDLNDGSPVIVGVGHGEATEEAVRWAARFAEEYGLGLGLVRATGDGPVFSVDGFLDVVSFYIDPDQRQVWTQEDLSQLAIAAQEATEAELDIATTSVPGLPATRLTEASTAASLLVIGQHRTLLSGTRHATQPLRHALAHARCPVAVVPVQPPR
jgi:nucleotide-binding universal stress UspA family protein